MEEFFNKILSRFGYAPKNVSEKESTLGISSYAGADPFAIWRSQKKVSPATALENYTGWVYACIKAIADEIGSMELKLFKIGKDTDKEIFEHEALDILNAPNEYQTGLELKFSIAAHLKSTGNAFLFKEGVSSETSKPLALHLMNPAKVKVIVDKNVFPTRIQGFQYTLGTKKYNFKPYEVIHLKDIDPMDPFEGIGTVQTIAQWIDTDNYAMEHNRVYFLNGARIGGILKSESALTTDQMEYLKLSFEAAFKGYQNAHKIVALPKGTSYEEGGKTQKDLDFNNMMIMMRDGIIAGFRVPKTLLGITDDVNRANAEATNYVFALRVIKPMMTLITSYLNEFLIPVYGTDLYYDFKNPVPEDRAQKIEEMKAVTGGQPIMTVNEAREEYLSKDPVEGGDELKAPFNMIPASDGLEPTIDPEDPTKPKRYTRNHIKSRFALNAKRRQEVSKSVAENISKEIQKVVNGVEEIKKKSIKEISEMTQEQYEPIYKGFAMRVDKYEKRYIKSIEEFNEKQKNEVKRNLPEITKAIKKDDLFNYKNALSVFVNLSSALLFDLAEKEGEEAGTLIGIPNMDILTPEVKRALDKSISLLSHSYNDTTRDLLKAKLEEGIKEGLSQTQLADIIDSVYDYSDKTRALAVARTETFRVANYSTQEAWRQSGIVKTQIWYTSNNANVCPYCEAINGKVVSIDEDFFKKGSALIGSDGTEFTPDYSDVGSPPLHTNCNCYIRPGEISLE